MSFRKRSKLSHANNKNVNNNGSVLDVAQAIEEKIEHALLVVWDDLPTWQRDNQYIRSGYRKASNSIRTSIASLGYLHNETVNIYSHLIGALLFVLTGVVLYGALKSRYETASHADVVAFGCFFLGVAICLGMSASYHTISNHSSGVASLGNKLDYIGIVVLIWGSFVASIYYGFYCHSWLQMVYWMMVRAAADFPSFPDSFCVTMELLMDLLEAQISALAIACSAISIVPRFRSPQWRPYRAAMFVAMGLSAIIPVFQGLHIYGVNKLKDQIGLYWLIGQGTLYILGAGIYAVCVRHRDIYPEKKSIFEH